MASKTVRIISKDLSGETGLKAFLMNTAGTILNTGGDTLTESGSSGVFDCTVTEAVSAGSRYSVYVLDSSDALAWSGGWVYFSGDTASVFLVDDPTAPTNANLQTIANTPVAVDTGTAGVISFVSGAYVATSGGTVNANIVQVGGENIHDDGNGRMEVTVSGYTYGQSPADHVLTTPANKLQTTADGDVVAGGYRGNAGAYVSFVDHSVNVTKWKGSAPSDLVSGRVDSYVGSIAANAITATAIAANAITSAKIATDAITSSQLAASAVAEIQSGLTVDGQAIADLVLAGLGSVNVTLVSPINTTTLQLTLVQDTDYLIANGQPLKFRVTAPLAAAGDTVRFAAKTKSQSIQATGTIVEIDNNLYAQVELNRTDHTNKADHKAGNDWRWELDWIDGDGNVASLVANQKMTIVPSYSTDA